MHNRKRQRPEPDWLKRIRWREYVIESSKKYHEEVRQLREQWSNILLAPFNRE